MKIGFTIGKFAPLHKGHQYLIEKGIAKYVDHPVPDGLQNVFNRIRDTNVEKTENQQENQTQNS